MRNILLFLLLLLCTRMQAQSWSYVGGNCPNAEGSAKIKIKSNGNVVTAAMTATSIVVKEWNGSSWTALPATPANGFIGEFHLEMHRDSIYLGIGATGFRVFKWTGAAWAQIGPVLPGTFSIGNHDFLLDNNGVPVIGLLLTREIKRMVGSSWQVAATLPMGTAPNTFVHLFGLDNSLVFNNQNELIFVSVYRNRQMVRKLTTTFQDQLLGDTAIILQPFSQYAPILKKNADGELFALFTAFGKRAFVKKLNGNSWQLYGDSSTFGISPGNMLFEIANNGALYFAQSGSIDKKIWTCAGPTASFQQLDLISHTGNFTQVTDLDVHPTDGKVHVAFNCLPTHSVMRYEHGATSNQELEIQTSINVYPNPATEVLQIENAINQNTCFEIHATDGRLVSAGTLENSSLNVSRLKAGLYRLNLLQANGKVQSISFLKN